MPRKPRQPSSTGIYHVILRGIDQQILFRNDMDYQAFLRFLIEVKKSSPFILYSYCLMNNHVHLLVRETETPLSSFMRRISVKYALHFNTKYSRTGHVFQDRYKSENVEDERYFLTVYRYILRNPVKAGLCQEPADYRWSSYSELFQRDSWVDSGLPVRLLGPGGLLEFVCMRTDDECMDV